VRDVSLDVAPGEFVAILGPSGCGKTTLLRVISGFLRPSQGHVLVDGVVVDAIPPNRREVGIVFQNYALFPHKTVAQNVAYGLQARGRPRSEIAARVTEMLALVRLEGSASKFPAQLSGGQQQRVALARALAMGPKLILLDEPFSALDKNLRVDVQIEVKRVVQQSGITTILVTHDQDEALGMADRIAVMHSGSVEQYDTPEGIYDRPATAFVSGFVGTSNHLPARVESQNARGSVVTLESGDRLPIEVPTAHGPAVILSVRPENLRLEGNAGPGRLPVHIGVAMPLGPRMVYEAALNDGTLLKIVEPRAPGGLVYAPGMQAFAAMRDASACSIFPRS
jgi:putative spermidine/putrescine transport system ATP-binding protein